MKISYNWLKEYIKSETGEPVNLSPQEIGDILTDIGLEVESIQKVTDDEINK